jgi:hypothetical protein
MHQSATVDEVLGYLEVSSAKLDAALSELLERSRIQPRKIDVEDSPGEFVVAIAEFGGCVLYWSDIEEGWELSELGEGCSIRTRGCNQFELQHVLYKISGPAVAG